LSDIYVDYVGSQSKSISVPDGLNISQRQNRRPWIPREATLWTQDLQMELLCFFQKITYPFRVYEEIPFQDPLRSEIRRFLISLDAYIESPNPVIPYRDILYGATDIKFAKRLKRIKRKSFETTWNVVHFELPDWWNDVPAYTIKDIGDIFNYSYLIFFQEDTDDYKFGFLPLDVKPNRLEQFKEALFELLPERSSFQKIEPIEILSQLSGSIGVQRGTLKHLPHYTMKDKYLSFSRRRHTCERSVIRVSPENCRDSILNDPGDLNTISLLDQQVMEMIRVLPGHIHLRDKEFVSKRLKTLDRDYNLFLHRDIRKEGITKPRALLKAMLEVLHEVYPDIEIFGYTSFYDEYEIHINGELIHPPRGHGLGMANSLTTLMQLVIHAMILDELENDMPLINSSCLCINDDFVAGFNDLEDLEAYWDKEDEVMGELSILRQPDKSFHSYRRFVIAERYFCREVEYEKTSYQLRELLLPLSCANVTHAKEYFIAAQTYVNSSLVPHYMSEIRSYWGYEFFPSEFIYPSKVGGWINEKINSVDMTLVLLDHLDLKSYVYRGFKATIRKLRRPIKGEFYTPPLMTLMGCPKIPKEHWDNFDILTYSQLNDKYGRILSKSPRNFVNFWEKLYQVRQKEFKIPFECTYDDLIIMIKSHYNTTQFYPSDSMILRYHPCNFRPGRISDPYLDPNPLMATVALYNPDIQYPFRESYSIRFTNIDSTTKKSLSLFSKEIERSLKSEALNVLCTGKYHEVYYPSDGYKPEEQYLNPVRIGEITALLNWGFGYPELRKNFEDPLVIEKKSIFGRLFSIEELIFITQKRLSRLTLKYIVDYLKDNPQYTIENTVEYLEDSLSKLQVHHIVKEEPEQYNDNHITLERLIDGKCDVFWAWRQDPDDFTVESEEVMHYLGKLSQYVTVGTHHDPLFKPERERLKREVDTAVDGPKLSFLVHRSGVYKLLDEELRNEDTLDLEEGFGDLFGD
jgi:hypothetical protein